MHEAFFEYLKKFDSNPLTEEEKAVFKSVLIPARLRKRQYFLQAGDECKNFAFITKGAMRRYTVDEKGVEHIDMLAIENWWMGDRESYALATPSVYNIEAFEVTEMLMLNRPDSMILRSIPAWCEMLHQLDENNNVANQKRIASSISLNAEKRYVDYAARYPQFVLRFPQHYIASYLGITKDTLSRIKRNLLLK